MLLERLIEKVMQKVMEMAEKVIGKATVIKEASKEVSREKVDHIQAEDDPIHHPEREKIPFPFGVFFVTLNCIHLSFVQIYAIFHFNYINYSGLLIFCCQNVATQTLYITAHNHSVHFS